MKIVNNKKGFTLVETVIYVGIIGMAIGAFVSFVLMISGLRNKFHVIEEVQANERAMQEIFRHYVRSAKAVISPGKASVDNRLDFLAQDSSLVHTFFVAGGQLILAVGSTTLPLTSDEVVISGIRFSNLSATGSPDLIQIAGKIANYASSSIDYIYEDDFRYNASLPY